MQLPIYQREDKSLVRDFILEHTGVDMTMELESCTFEKWEKYRSAHYEEALAWKRAQNFPDCPVADGEYREARARWSRGLFV